MYAFSAPLRCFQSTGLTLAPAMRTAISFAAGRRVGERAELEGGGGAVFGEDDGAHGGPFGLGFG